MCIPLTILLIINVAPSIQIILDGVLDTKEARGTKLIEKSIFPSVLNLVFPQIHLHTPATLESSQYFILHIILSLSHDLHASSTFP